MFASQIVHIFLTFNNSKFFHHLSIFPKKILINITTESPSLLPFLPSHRELPLHLRNDGTRELHVLAIPQPRIPQAQPGGRRGPAQSRGRHRQRHHIHHHRRGCWRRDVAPGDLPDHGDATDREVGRVVHRKPISRRDAKGTVWGCWGHYGATQGF